MLRVKAYSLPVTSEQETQAQVIILKAEGIAAHRYRDPGDTEYTDPKFESKSEPNSDLLKLQKPGFYSSTNVWFVSIPGTAGALGIIHSSLLPRKEAGVQAH